MPSSPVRGRGLATKHAWVWSALIGLLLAASGLIAARFTWRATVTGVEAVQRERAIAAAARIGHFIDGIRQPLRWMVDDPARRDTAALETLQVELLQMLRRLPALTELRWIDAGGRERLALSRLAMDVVGSGRDRSADPLVLGARRDGASFGTVTFLRGSEPHVALALAAHPAGPVLWVEVNLKAVWEITRATPEAAGGIAYVVDANGQLIAHPDLGLVLRRTDMSALAHVRAALAVERAMVVQEARGLDGSTVFAAAAPVPQFHWTVVIEQARQQALGPVWQALGQSALLTVAGVLLAVLASTWLARRLVQPIQALQARAADIAAGRLDQRIAVHSGDELQALGEQFNRMAANLQGIYASLEARVAERTAALAEANQAKSRFLAAASHDLRQPVHALGLFVGQLRRADLASRDALMTHIERAVAAFETLLESLLDISRLDAGTVAVRREAMALEPLLERLAAGFAPAAAARSLRLRCRPTTLWVDSDPVLLERILLNLIGNSLRYTHDGGVLIGARRRGDTVEIVVADTGVGIPADQQAHVFREFYRVPGASANGEPGLGLGLAIVRRLVALLGHGLDLRSALGRGTCFRLGLPLANAQRQLAALTVAGEPLAGRHVLVIDDDAAVREAMLGQLTQWGCQVAVAADRQQAVARWPSERPELVITDLHLAGGDGLALALELRALGAGSILVVTGDTASARWQAVRDAGFSLLAKPLRPARLRAAMEALLVPGPPT